MEIKGRSVVIGFLWLSAAVTALYWISFFTGGEVQSSEDPCYLVFESAFPAADGWMAIAFVAAAEGLRRGREWAVLFGIAAGSAAIYLGCMDVLYNLEHDMYESLSTPMLGEVVINVYSFGFGTFLMRYFWAHRRGFEVAR
jgi:hypothetical protein